MDDTDFVLVRRQTDSSNDRISALAEVRSKVEDHLQAIGEPHRPLHLDAAAKRVMRFSPQSSRFQLRRFLLMPSLFSMVAPAARLTTMPDVSHRTSSLCLLSILRTLAGDP